MEIRIQRYTDTWRFRYRGTRIHGDSDTGIYGYIKILIQGYTNTRIHGDLDTGIYG